MRLWSLIIIIFVTGFFLNGCASRDEVKLFDYNIENVESIGTYIYNFEDTHTTNYWSYLDDEMFEFIDYLNSIHESKVLDFTPKSDQSKLYGFEINRIDSGEDKYLLCGNYLITENGEYYEVNGEELIDHLTLIDQRQSSYQHLDFILNHRYLSLYQGTWDTEYMLQSPFEDSQLIDVKIEVETINITTEAEQIGFTVINDSSRTFTFGSRVYLEAKVDDEWYVVGDMIRDGINIGWTDELHILESGKKRDYQFHFNYLQPLPSGKYRIGKVVTDEEGIDLAIFSEFNIN